MMCSKVGELVSGDVAQDRYQLLCSGAYPMSGGCFVNDICGVHGTDIEGVEAR
jgi:hypothetical protein